MMVKKAIAIFFILLANIILLAHAVVPHHHHQEFFCFETSHCQTDVGVADHQTTHDNHEHDGDNGTENCILKQLVIIPDNQAKHELKIADPNKNHPSVERFQAILSDNNSAIIVPLLAENRFVPLLSSCYIHTVNTGLGLRAPPIV